MDISIKLNQLTAEIEIGIDRLLPPASQRPSRIHEAMRYSMTAGGKRLRPVFVLATAEIFAPLPPPPDSRLSPLSPLPAAVAIECVHTYSLIHDDLPCMDDDDLRRGRPTSHRAFDEATALLAGDALLTEAFSLLVAHYEDQPALAVALVRELSAAAGSRRLIGGQMEDLLSERRNDATAESLDFIHLNKTAAMIEASLVLGGLVAGASPDSVQRLRNTGRNLGLAFQIVDDVLDATGDSATLGKTAGKDARAQKTTYVALHGIEASRRIAQELTERAATIATSLPGETEFLVALIRSLADRIR